VEAIKQSTQNTERDNDAGQVRLNEDMLATMDAVVEHTS